MQIQAGLSLVAAMVNLRMAFSSLDSDWLIEASLIKIELVAPLSFIEGLLLPMVLVN